MPPSPQQPTASTSAPAAAKKIKSKPQKKTPIADAAHGDPPPIPKPPPQRQLLSAKPAGNPRDVVNLDSTDGEGDAAPPVKAKKKAHMKAKKQQPVEFSHSDELTLSGDNPQQLEPTQSHYVPPPCPPSWTTSRSTRLISDSESQAAHSTALPVRPKPSWLDFRQPKLIPISDSESQPARSPKLDKGKGKQTQSGDEDEHQDSGDEYISEEESLRQAIARSKAELGVGGELQPDFGGEMQPDFGGDMQPDFGDEMQPEDSSDESMSGEQAMKHLKEVIAQSNGEPHSVLDSVSVTLICASEDNRKMKLAIDRADRERRLHWPLHTVLVPTSHARLEMLSTVAVQRASMPPDGGQYDPHSAPTRGLTLSHRRSRS